jgi:hypothetical protein
MATGVILEFEGATLEQYDQVIEKMGLHKGGPTAPGGLFHWVAQTDTGIRVIDVWEDQATFEKFAETQIGPITREVGFPGAPVVTFADVHNYLIAK